MGGAAVSVLVVILVVRVCGTHVSAHGYSRPWCRSRCSGRVQYPHPTAIVVDHGRRVGNIARTRGRCWRCDFACGVRSQQLVR